MTALKLENVNKSFGPVHVLKDINLTVEEGEFVVFVGPSGCGKSTLLRCLNRMNDVIPICRVEGSIKLAGQDIYAPEVDVVALRPKVGMVFQKPNPFPKSIFDNIIYGPKIHGLAKTKQQCEIAVDPFLFQLAGCADSFPRAGNLDEDALSTDARLFIESDDPLGPLDGLVLVEGELCVHFS